METIDKYLYKNHTDQTAKTYLYYIDVFLMQHPKAKTYLYKDIIDYVDDFKRKNPEINMLCSKFAAIKRYYDYLLQTGQRKDHPCKNLHLKSKVKAIQIQDLFSTVELESLMNRENKYKNLDLRNKIIISLLINQALLSAELCRIEIRDIDLDAGTIYIKGSKTGTARTLDLKPNQILLIQKYTETARKKLLKSSSTCLIITQRGDAETVEGILSMIEPLKALYPERKLRAVTIRQSVLSNLLNEKKASLEDVQLFAGHRWPSTTERYRRKNLEEQRILINMYHPLK